MEKALSTEFAKKRPDLVARELEKFSIDDVVVFLTQLDDQISARVTADFSTRVLVRLLDSLSAERIAGLLCASSPRDAHEILAHLPGSEYERILNAARPADRAFIQSLFGLSAQTIGMQTSNRFVRVFTDDTCGAVLRELATSEPADNVPIVAVDREGCYRGYVPLLYIMQTANIDRNVEDFLLNVQPLARNASASSVLSLGEWDEYTVLPVIDDAGRLEGVVALRDLRRQTGFISEAEEDHPFYSVLDMYLNLCADLLTFFLAGRKP